MEATILTEYAELETVLVRWLWLAVWADCVSAVIIKVAAKISGICSRQEFSSQNLFLERLIKKFCAELT